MAATKGQERVNLWQLKALQCRTSFKNIAQTKNADRVKLPDTSDGRKYGYVAQNSPWKTLGHRSCGFASAPPYNGLQIIAGLGLSLHQLVCLDARDCNPTSKNGGHEGKSLSHIGKIGDITEYALHHPDVAIEHTRDTSTGKKYRPFS